MKACGSLLADVIVLVEALEFRMAAYGLQPDARGGDEMFVHFAAALQVVNVYI